MLNRRELERQSYKYFLTTCGLICFIVFFLGTFFSFIFAEETESYEWTIVLGFGMLFGTSVSFCCVLHESRSVHSIELQQEESDEPQLEQELPLRPQSDQESPLRPQSDQELPLRPQSDQELLLQPQSDQELPLQPQSDQELPLQSQSDQELQPQSDQELPLQPQSDQELPLHPQSDQELPLQPQSDQELPLQPQSDQELPLQPQSDQELPLQPQSDQELPLQPQQEPKMSGQSKTEPHWKVQAGFNFASLRHFFGISPTESGETKSSENDSDPEMPELRKMAETGLHVGSEKSMAGTSKDSQDKDTTSFEGAVDFPLDSTKAGPSKVAGKSSEVTESRSDDEPLKDMSALSLSDSCKYTTDSEEKQAEVSAALSQMSLDGSEKQATKISAKDHSSTDSEEKSEAEGELSKLESKKEA